MKINSFIGKQVVIMVFDILYRHWVTILTILVFAIKLSPGKRFRNTETKYFWLTVLSTLILVIEDIIEVLCASDPSLRFVRIFVSVIGYTMRSVAGLSLLLVVLPYKKRRFIYWIPALITLATSSTAFFSDIAFGYDENYDFYRGPLGYVAFAVPIFYAIMILVIVFKNFYEKSSIERFIVPVCTIFCLSTSFLDAMYGGVRLNEAIIISGVFFYLILYSNDIRRDSLTNLLNRQAFYDDCSIYNRSIEAAASIDMNGLKDLNDSLGHEAGDKALKKIGECMIKASDEKTLVYRVGGDEFVILFLHSDEKIISDVVKKIAEDVTKAGYSISTGYSIRSHKDSIDDVVRESDKLMYQDKAGYYHSKGMEHRVDHYQPQGITESENE